MTEFTNSVVLRWKKDLDDFIFGEIKHKITENGMETEYLLNEKAFMAAIKKQIPKKPLISWDSMTGRYYCPNCKGGIVVDKSNYCADCGQALDWSDSK